MRSAQVGHNDSLTTVKMRPYDPTVQGAVLLFKDKDCRNDVGRFYAPVSNTEKMSYTKSEMWDNNIENDEITSLMVPFGYSVDLY